MRTKNTGIDWIGDIPEYWQLKPIQFCLNEINDKNTPIKTDQVLSLVKDKGVMLYEEKGNQGNKAKEDIGQYKVAYPNTLIVNSMNILIGSVGISEYLGCVSPVYYVFKETKESDLRYINYIFNTREFQKELRKYANGILEIRLRVSSYDIFKRKIPLPSKEEQKKISDFLDKKIGEINSLYSDIEKQIEKLEEYKISVITEAVSRGLNPNAELKEEKNKWYGYIPKQWDILKSLYVLSQPITDGPHTTPELFDEGIPFVSAEAVSCGKGGIDFDHIRGYISQEFYEECCKKYIPKIDDIYLIKSGATTGKVSIVKTDKIFTIRSPLAVFRCDTKKMLPKYLFYCLQSTPFQNQIQDGWTYGTQQNIGMRTLEHLKVSKPPLDEQNEIIKYLDDKCGNIDDIISKKENQLDTLDQYKKSLIYEYVTGKKEVPSTY